MTPAPTTIPCGLVLADPAGLITWVNDRILSWVGCGHADLIGKPTSSLLTRGSALHHEMRVRPTLALAGSVEEVAAELRTADVPCPVLMSASVEPDGHVCWAIFRALERRRYERELLDANRRAARSHALLHGVHVVTADLVGAQSVREVAEALRLPIDVHGGQRQLELVLGPELDARPDRPRTDVDEQAVPVAVGLDADGVAGLLRVEVAAQDVDDVANALAVLVHPVEQALRRVSAKDEERRLMEHLERISTTDPLTGLPNRRYVDGLLDGLLPPPPGSGVALVFLDLDGFKAVNDGHGHDRGDDVLRQVAALLTAAVRPDDEVARLAGDEFVIVLRDVTADDAAAVAERLARSVRIEVGSGGDAVVVTASVGVAFAGSHHVDAAALLRAADRAMYDAKAQGGGWLGHDRARRLCTA